jgi:hypothetical protein
MICAFSPTRIFLRRPSMPWLAGHDVRSVKIASPGARDSEVVALAASEERIIPELYALGVDIY